MKIGGLHIGRQIRRFFGVKVMNNTNRRAGRRRKAGVLAAALSGLMALSMPAAAQGPERTSSETVHEENLQAQSAAKHHYAPGQRHKERSEGRGVRSEGKQRPIEAKKDSRQSR